MLGIVGGIGGGQLGHRFRDTLEDRCVSGATTQVAGELLFDLRCRRGRVVRQQALHRHEESRCAESTLECVALPHRLLDEPQFITVAQRLDGLDVRSLRLHRQHQAGPDGLTVDRHRARTTHTVLAAEMRAGEPEVIAQQLSQAGCVPLMIVCLLLLTEVISDEMLSVGGLWSW